MIRLTSPLQSGIKFILLGLFLFSSNNLDAQQLSRDELNSELRKALEQTDGTRSLSLIKDNRLLIKPFVDALIKESITTELKGKTDEAAKLQAMSVNASKYFENSFGEKSLSIAVNYLTVWTEEQKKQKLVADSLYTSGTQNRLKGEYDKAIEFFKPALELYENIGDERGESEILGSYGAVYFNSGKYEEALEYYKAALIKREKVNDMVLTGNTLSSIGSVYFEYYEDFEEALKYLDRAEAVRIETGETAALGRTLQVKAGALEEMGQFEQALEYFEKSYELNLISGDKRLAAQAMLHSGQILNTNGKYPEAIDHLEKSLAIYRDQKLRQGEGNALSQLGFVYSNLGDLNKAIELISEASGILKETNDLKGLAGVYNHLGIVLMDAGRYEKALEYYLVSLDISEKLEDNSLLLPAISNIGTLYKEMKDYPRAEEYHLRGLGICREMNAKVEEVHFLLNLANDQIMLGKLNDAKGNYDSANGIAKSLNNPDLDWRIVVGTAEYYEQMGEYKLAVELNDSALNILEGMRSTIQSKEQKAHLMSSERFAYEDIISLLETLHEKDMTKGYDKLSFLYAERSKSRVLLDLLAESTAKINTKPQNADLQKPEPVSIDEAKQLCPDKNTVLLEYSVGDSSSCLWVITRSNHKLFKIPGRKIIQEQIETIRFALLDPRQGISEFFANAGTLLYEELIKPAEPFLSKKSRLIIIPDGILNYLPFEVLLTGDNKFSEGASLSDVPYLIRKYPVSYGQSASVLKKLISKPEKESGQKAVGNRLLAIGDPLYEDTSFNTRVKYPRLEFTGGEIENIASYFTTGSSEIYVRSRATEENLKRNSALNEFNYLHFATHGLIDEAKPDLSSLVLTSGRNSGEDGFLQAAEIFDLKLNADLVVLSACQTGLGKLIRGEGMVGLTRAFMYAGTPSVLVSLWSVSDMSTAALMGEFYKNLIKNKFSKTDALRKAQITLMSDEKYAHPFYWAPFVLIGDWR